MTITIQIRNVPDEIHRRLEAHAAIAGMSLSKYLLDAIRHLADRPTIKELQTRLASRSAVAPDISPAEAVRAERDG